jgi:hypothetical protein
LIAATSAAFCGVSGKLWPSSSKASTAVGGNSRLRISTRSGIARVTCTFRRTEVTCQPRACKLPCSFGKPCFSLAATAELGTASTSTPSWNDSTSQLPATAGSARPTSRCRSAMRIAVGNRLAMRSFERRKLVASNEVGRLRVP